MVISDKCVIVIADTAPLVNTRNGCVTDDFSIQGHFQGFLVRRDNVVLRSLKIQTRSRLKPNIGGLNLTN